MHTAEFPATLIARDSRCLVMPRRHGAPSSSAVYFSIRRSLRDSMLCTFRAREIPFSRSLCFDDAAPAASESRESRRSRMKIALVTSVRKSALIRPEFDRRRLTARAQLQRDLNFRIHFGILRLYRRRYNRQTEFTKAIDTLVRIKRSAGFRLAFNSCA